MKGFTSFLIIWCIFLRHVKSEICPSPEDIYPCECQPSTVDLSIVCSGHEVTQNTIDAVFQEARAVNQGQGQWLRLDNVQILFVNLTNLDLTPLMNITVNYLDISYNSHLESLTGPPVDLFAGKIEAKYFRIHGAAALSDKGLGEILKYLSPFHLKNLQLTGTQLTGSATTTSEMFPALTTFYNLETLELFSNKIHTIGGGQFARFDRLKILYLHDNPIEIIGDDAFQFNVLRNVSQTYIELQKCRLTEANISPRHGLDKIPGIVLLSLIGNNISTISSLIFEPFLRTMERNTVFFFENPIICDERVKWLKDERDYFEPLVRSPECINDPGFTVFTSDKIPSFH